MSIRYFCDMCGEEIQKPTDANRIARQHANITVEVFVAVDGVWNGGHVCADCVVRVVDQGEPVPSSFGK